MNTMETTGSKSRTQSRCREWERQRRNKFNDAVSRLGDIVKEITKSNDNSSCKESESVQYPKIEIIQKATLCLTNCKQENTQLKAEILALQVELSAMKNKTTNDASTQVFLSVGRSSRLKSQSNKYLKVVDLQKLKRNEVKEKTVLTTNSKIKSVKPNTTKQIPTQILPKLLPQSNANGGKKTPENTIVVLPASSYIFPQRPLLFPTVPPAIVLVDSNLQNLNKLTSPIIYRNNGDVTKTTMVNVLPISAYSRPLSATKMKKNTVKSKKDNNKKIIKPSKTIEKNNDPEKSKQLPDNGIRDVPDNKVKDNSPNKIVSHNLVISTKDNNLEKVRLNTVENKEINKTNVHSAEKVCVTENIKININSITKKEIKENNVVSEIENKDKGIVEMPKNKINATPNAKTTLSTAVTEKPNNLVTEENGVKLNKIAADKIALTIDKDKENKMPNILETTICDPVVDGGNARLELAEEFLAASPTAAFLMSFPLVSGNRADSPADETQNTVQTNNKDSNHRRNELTTQATQYFDKNNTNDPKVKLPSKLEPSSSMITKNNEPLKYTEHNLITKQHENKTIATTTSNASSDNPFLNLPMPSLISTSTISDTTFGLDYDTNISKSIQNQSASYASNGNFFYKSDPFNTMKNTIYSTSSISSTHDFNNLALYPCAMEKYSSKSKCDYPNVDENLMKIGSSRLTYDIDLGWSHKSFDFVNCTTSSNSFNKDNILNTVSAPYSSSYNPFNPEFHMPIVTTTSKKDNVTNKTNTSFADTITSFYSQPTNLWPEEVPFYTNSNFTKTVPSKHQSYINVDSLQTNTNTKPIEKNFETNVKQTTNTTAVNAMKTTNVPVGPQVQDKYTKKSPSKMHINWMTSEVRHNNMDNINCNSIPVEVKDHHKTSYSQINHSVKKQDHNESYFPISMHNFASQPTQEEFQMWPTTRTIGPTEITIEPPPLNLPTLVGDLALGPHDKKKNADISNRPPAQAQDIQNCGNFLSVTQLMNRSSDNMSSRYQAPSTDPPKAAGTKQISSYFSNDTNRKTMTSRMESQLPQPCYGFNESKSLVTYENMAQFSQNKSKTNKPDKSFKSQKNSYSAESLIRGGCTQKVQDTGVKFAMSSQKYNEFNSTQDSSVAQVSHFPPIIDYTDNSYATQQFSGTTLYNTTTNTISNSFYSNLMPSSSNLMSSNYTSGPFSGEFIDYNNQTECNYTNHKYEELKMRNNPTAFPQEKVPSNYKSSRRDSATKHKLECNKKESNKKYQSKRAKLNTEVEEWNDPSHLLWQNKAVGKRHNLVSEELPFPNYVGNQMPAQYQPEFFNSHLVPSNVQAVGHNVDRSLNFPVTSRANFNLSTIFPEITMKVQ